MKYWLLKSEPDVYSLDDLKSEGTGHWDGVRNYQARNNLQAMNHRTGTALAIFQNGQIEALAEARPSTASKVAQPLGLLSMSDLFDL